MCGGLLAHCCMVDVPLFFCGGWGGVGGLSGDVRGDWQLQDVALVQWLGCVLTVGGSKW